MDMSPLMKNTLRRLKKEGKLSRTEVHHKTLEGLDNRGFVRFTGHWIKPTVKAKREKV